MESELFGHEKGSFTGANEKKEGLVEQANTGTLFLDEIAELPLPMQAKLLQLIQEKTYTPVGSVIPKKVDIRIIAATNQNLKKLMLSGEFREDLYYRLALGVIEIPPLRERKTDALNLINYYLGVFNKKYESNVSLSTESLYILKQYSWPGNIRELEHVIEFLIVNANYPEEEIGKNSLPNNMIEEVKIPANFENLKRINDGDQSLEERMETVERKIIEEVYQKYKSSYKIAEVLKISQSKAHRLINKYCRK